MVKNMQSDFHDEKIGVSSCACCGGLRVREIEIEKRLEIKNPRGDDFFTTIKIPVIECVDCHIQLSDERAEEIEDNAIRDSLGLLRPNEIVAIRELRGLSQRDLAEITGFGVASIARWESRANLQNLASDRMLRLLQDDSAYERLRGMPESGGKSLPTRGAPMNPPFFRALVSRPSLCAAIVKRSNMFDLHSR